MGRTQKKNLMREQEIYLYNCMIMEIANNWDAITDLMFRYYNKLLKEVLPIENEWITFLSTNGLRPELFDGDATKFVESYAKSVN